MNPPLQRINHHRGPWQMRQGPRCFVEAERFCRDALHASEQLQDPWGTAPAWRALGETYRDMGRLDEARSAFERALAGFQQLELVEEVRITEEMLCELPVQAVV